MNRVKRELTIAGIQMESIHGKVEENHKRATKLIEKATKDGAELIILPELFSCGYIANKDIWKYGEPTNSKTVKWLKETSKKLGIYLGAGLVEIVGNDYINSFILSNPKGEIEGRITKNKAESYCFKRGEAIHIINTPFAKIGVGICADNHYTNFIKQMQENYIDLLLMPHAWASPFKESKTVNVNDMIKIEEEIKSFPSLVRSLIGVPTVFVNQIGNIATISGVLGKLMSPNVFKLQGYSKIVDADGTIKAELNDEVGIVLAKVALDPTYKIKKDIPNYNGWIHRGSKLVRKVIIPLDIFIGSLVYKLSVKKKICK